MKRFIETFRNLAVLGILLACWTLVPQLAGAKDGLVQVVRDIDHTRYETLLKKFVDDRGLVNYADWKSSPEDLRVLIDYTDSFAATGPWAIGDERVASLINAYNALTLRFILELYPTESIRELNDPFGKRRHEVGGRRVSLDDIEHQTLRPLAGYRVHAALVCAARSCPPLRREAFRPESLDTQLNDAMRIWLARDDLNSFVPEERVARISSIFRWFGEDFREAGGLDRVLVRHGPAEAMALFQQRRVDIEYLDYNWGLNDQGGLGTDYKRSLWKKLFGN